MKSRVGNVKMKLKVVLAVVLSTTLGGCAVNVEKLLDVKEPELAAALPQSYPESEVQTILVADGNFEAGSYTLREEADQIVVQAVRILKRDADATALIEGHTDTTKSAHANQIQAARRSYAVRNALIAEGIDADRINIITVGGAEPVASNDTADGREANRRVEIHFAN